MKDKYAPDERSLIVLLPKGKGWWSRIKDRYNRWVMGRWFA